ncbi:MAG: hypothetical protein MPJ22_00065 [Pirellulales bacterium]|nr:hypothetical protein [Pirellulales bacterium]
MAGDTSKPSAKPLETRAEWRAELDSALAELRDLHRGTPDFGAVLAAWIRCQAAQAMLNKIDGKAADAAKAAIEATGEMPEGVAP